MTAQGQAGSSWQRKSGGTHWRAGTVRLRERSLQRCSRGILARQGCASAKGEDAAITETRDTESLVESCSCESFSWISKPRFYCYLKKR